jgi:hypothetical protein
MIYTWMLCLFDFPAYIDCNVGYRIPSSQGQALPSLSIVDMDTDTPRQLQPRLPPRQPDLPPLPHGPATKGTAGDPRGMCSKYCEIYLFVVCAIGQFLAIINVAMLRTLVAEVLRLTKHQNVTRLVKNTVRFFKIPALSPAGTVLHVFLEQFKHLHGLG